MSHPGSESKERGETEVSEIEDISSYVDGLLSHACENVSSDVHIDPSHEHVLVRLRVSGRLVDHGFYIKTRHEEVVGRIKVLSKLRTDIHDKSQDGRFFYMFDKERIDVRVSVLPTFYGENIVLRILRPDLHRDRKLLDLGLSVEQAELLRFHIQRDHGVIVVAGPTGSGKTTTIYTLVSLLLKSARNIVTIEDPVEYVIPGVRQVQVSEMADFGFAAALRAILRQDPDIIILGEIRDSETAKLAFQASLTGHLVITTIHAEDSAGVYSRLSDLGVSKEMMHSLSLMVSQRLIKVPSSPDRVGAFEVIPVEGKIKVTLFQNTFPEYIRAALRKQGVLLLQDAVESLYKRNE